MNEVLVCFLMLVGSVLVYALVTWFFIRKLKRGVKNWHPNKGVRFAIGLGRDKLFFPKLSGQERTLLKQQITAPYEVVSDEEIDFFLKLYGRHLFWFLVLLALFLTIAMAIISQVDVVPYRGP